MTTPRVKALAFLLPQFHPIPENDQWWGKGFTEWRNVARARPNFVGHHQPQLPADLGFYDLRVPEVRAEQAELARRYGIHGFCYYYYWFAGKRLLEKPLDAVLHSGEPDFPYCVCWANENWTRTWDGNSREVLMGQQHSREDSLAFIRSLIPHFKDPRYIRVNGAPMLLVYRVDIIPDMANTAELWRQECRAHGIEELHLVAVQSFGIGDPRLYGCDAAVEFPPHGTDMDWNCNAAFADRMLNPSFSGNIIDVEHVIRAALNRAPEAYPLYRGVMPAWDNTARRQDTGLTFVNTTPERYEYWLAEITRQSVERHDEAHRFVFINAWNEWAEGAHLEPDLKDGHVWLQATARALSGSSTLSSLPGVAIPVPDSSAVASPTPTHYRIPLRTRLALTGYRAMRAVYRKLPVSKEHKQRLIDIVFRATGPLLSGTPAYQVWEGRRHVPAPEPVLAPQANGDIGEVDAATLSLPTTDTPRVSVIIPVYNKIEYTLHCLASIARHPPSTPFEVLVIDDCSTDSTAEKLALAQGVRVIRNATNQGFLRNCNLAVDHCRGDYLLFLNNDTEVMAGWLDELVAVAENDAKAGLVGSMLVYPNGTLQEAGGIIWRDASGINYGREQHPHRPEFNYVRESDYCSGASILISKKLFDKLGRFDERYVPAYYEDTDLAFKVRDFGYKVVYTPFSKVIHFEGITSGTDVNSGVKAYQLTNQKKFYEKWQQQLASHGEPETHIVLQRERKAGKRAFVMDVVTPLPDKDSGSVDTLNHLKLLVELGYKVTFMPDSLAHHGHYTEALQRLGIECLYGPFVKSAREHLEREGQYYDLVLLKRVHYAARYIDDARRYCPNAKVIFDTVDLHYVREMRQAEIENSAAKKKDALKTRALEWSVMQRADATIVISEEEKKRLASEMPAIDVYAIPYIRDIPGCRNKWESRRDIVFIGGYLHEPNVDAVRYFCTEIWPIVHAHLPDARFRIVGSNMPAAFSQLKEIPGVIPEGFAADLDPVFDAVRLSVAPLRFGAGIKGKVGSSMSYGVPCVVTPVAAEGMGLQHEQSAMIAATPVDFADAVIRAYRDQTLWERLSDNGLQLMRSQYSAEQGRERWLAMLTQLSMH